jgi:oligopeptide transport system substrate-binding protein
MALKYTFHLRDNVFFHDDDCFENNIGRKVTAHDFKYCFDRLCYNNPAENQGFWIFKDIVLGANEYYAKTETNKKDFSGISGIVAIDDTTLHIQLIQPYAVFLARLGLIFTKVYPKEAVEKYGSEMRLHCVGTGPFFIKKILDNQVVFLTKNKKYWAKDEYGNQLPFLENIKVTFIHEKKTELQEFVAGKSDLVYKFPLEMIDEIIDINTNLKPAYQKFQLQVSAFYVFAILWIFTPRQNISKIKKLDKHSVMQ